MLLKIQIGTHGLMIKKNTELLETGKFPNTIEKQLKYLETEIISEKKLFIY